MAAFFDSLGLLEIILFIIASSSTLILIIQTVLSVIGAGDDGDFDGCESDLVENASASADVKSGKANFDADGLRIFTMRGILAFLMVGCWVGFIGIIAEIPPVAALLCALASGTASLFGIAKLMQLLMSLHHDGTLKVSNAIGQVGTVYIRIPGDEKGVGKVSVTVQERFCEFDAVTESGEELKTGEAIYVTDVRPGNVLVVEKLSE